MPNLWIADPSYGAWKIDEDGSATIPYMVADNDTEDSCLSLAVVDVNLCVGSGGYNLWKTAAAIEATLPPRQRLHTGTPKWSTAQWALT